MRNKKSRDSELFLLSVGLGPIFIACCTQNILLLAFEDLAVRLQRFCVDCSYLLRLLVEQSQKSKFRKK